MSTWKQLKQAAANLRHQADVMEKAAASFDQTIKTAGQRKTAGEKVRLGQLAKTASDKLLESGLVSSREQADVFANQLLDHGTAIEKLAQLTQFVNAPKIGSVVVDESTSQPETADDVYAKHAQAALSRLNLT